MNLRQNAHRSALAIFTAALFSLTTSAMAADEGAVPQAQTQNGITYVTGGIGEPETTAMRSAASKYPIMMTFARDNGSFVTSVNVSITDQQGTSVLELVSEPILLVDLPKGTYKVQASVADSVQSRTVNVSGQTQRLGFSWPSDVVQEQPTPVSLEPTPAPLAPPTPAPDRYVPVTPAPDPDGVWGKDSTSPFLE